MVIFTWKTRFSSHNVPVPDSLPPWRHCECSKYVFYMVEGCTKAFKKAEWKIFFHLGENWCSKNFFYKKKIENRKSKKSDFWILRFLRSKHFEIEIFDLKIFRSQKSQQSKIRFFRFSIFGFFFEKNIFWKSIFSKMKKYFSLCFFLMPWYILLLYRKHI